MRELHKEIRLEIIELCGEGKFFHIGCDEAIVCDDPECYERAGWAREQIALGFE